MIDKTVENRIAQLKDFINLWASYFALYKRVSNQNTFTEEEEKGFLELKSTLARKYQGLMDSLGIKPTAEDRTFDVISQVMSLKSVANLSPLQGEKMENDWHNSYITLNKILGSLENKKTEMAKINPLALTIKKLFSNPVFALVLMVIVITFVYYVLKLFQS